MSFVSVSFAGVLAVALLLRFTAGRRGRGAGFLGALWALSLVFYAWHVPAYLGILLLSTFTDWVAALAIERADGQPRARRVWLAASLVVNLGLLGFFKYSGLILETAAALARGLGLDAQAPVARVLLPIGISFYTFQSLSYTIDVYRGHLRAEPHFWRFGLFVSFFPQLVAGPIVRAGEFLYQLERPRRPRVRVLLAGGYLVLRGLFLKLVVADNLGLLVDEHWAAAAQPGAPTWLALSMLVFFSCQLFCDFAGYTDIARGLAYVLGFRLPVNFDAPFLAASFREFWRRWHITLSQWMRDYLYVPLGGGRRGRGRGLVNLLLVMTISGLWHGASPTFALWGLLHGATVALERGFGLADRRRPGFAGLLAAGLWFVVVQAVWTLSMALFRGESAAEAAAILSNLFAGTSAGSGAPAGLTTGWWFTLPVWLLHARTLASERFGLAVPGPRERALVAGAMAYALLTLYASARGFIYFQF